MMQNYLQLLKDNILAGNVPQMIEAMIGLAIQYKASDIHIEPTRNVIPAPGPGDGVEPVDVVLCRVRRGGQLAPIPLRQHMRRARRGLVR